MVLLRAGDIYNCDDSLRTAVKVNRKTGSDRKVIYNKTTSSQARLCDSVPSISYFSLTFWVKTSLCASWHICSSGHINELFCETPKHCLTQYFSLERTICSCVTCFSTIPVTFLYWSTFPTLINEQLLFSSHYRVQKRWKVNKLPLHNMSHYTAGHSNESQLTATGEHPSSTSLYTGLGSSSSPAPFHSKRKLSMWTAKK